MQDPNIHLKNLKPSPVASPIVDSCIECGFCESNCPSRDITLTPRQRITTFREMSRLEQIEERTQEEEQRCVPPLPPFYDQVLGEVPRGRRFS